MEFNRLQYTASSLYHLPVVQRLQPVRCILSSPTCSSTDILLLCMQSICKICLLLLHPPLSHPLLLLLLLLLLAHLLVLLLLVLLQEMMAVTEHFQSMLELWFTSSLQSKNHVELLHCLETYALVTRQHAAEQMFQGTVIQPYVSQVSCVYVCVCMSVCLYVCMYVRMYVCCNVLKAPKQFISTDSPS